VNIVHEQFANSTPKCSPKSLFPQSGEHFSWTIRELFDELFANIPILPSRRGGRTLIMISFRTTRQTVRQNPFLPPWRTLFVNNSRTVRAELFAKVTFFQDLAN
jgi:hypothetical protein